LHLDFHHIGDKLALEVYILLNLGMGLDRNNILQGMRNMIAHLLILSRIVFVQYYRRYYHYRHLFGYLDMLYMFANIVERIDRMNILMLDRYFLLRYLHILVVLVLLRILHLGFDLHFVDRLNNQGGKRLLIYKMNRWRMYMLLHLLKSLHRIEYLCQYLDIEGISL
jgi:hypothetical protein